MSFTKRYTAVIIPLILGGMLLTGAGVLVFGQSTESQTLCDETTSICETQTTIEIQDTITPIFAYIMIIMGVVILLINWRITNLIEGEVDKTNPKP
jgi:uncharacterized membrane protein